MKIVTTLPTYNEADNIAPLIEALLRVSKFMEVLVIDDNSPDGTWRIVETMAGQNPRVHLLHRTSERGRGTAGIAGFKKALEIGADIIVEMDADWSHHPRFLRPMLRACRKSDVVIGSRLVPGGGETGRSRIRTLITAMANIYIRTMLGLRVRDCTSGYRVFRRWVLEKIDWDRMESTGPAIVQEVLVSANVLGAKITEHPILFEERRAGASTFNSKIILAGLLAQPKLRLRPAPVRII